jgi:hypothetical protein
MSKHCALWEFSSLYLRALGRRTAPFWTWASVGARMFKVANTVFHWYIGRRFRQA